MFIVFIYLLTSSQRKNYWPNATGPLSICEAMLQHDSFYCNLYQSSPARRDLAALCNHRTTTWLEESFSCGLSQWIRGLRWIACTCDVVGSNLAPVPSHPSHLSLFVILAATALHTVQGGRNKSHSFISAVDGAVMMRCFLLRRQADRR